MGEASEGVIGRVASFVFFVFSYGSPLGFALTLISVLIFCLLQLFLRASLFCSAISALLLSLSTFALISYLLFDLKLAVLKKVLLAPFISFGYNMLFNIYRSSTDEQIPSLSCIAI